MAKKPLLFTTRNGNLIMPGLKFIFYLVALLQAKPDLYILNSTKLQSDATSSFSTNERVCYNDIISDVSPGQQQVKDEYEALTF